ncbi:RNA polymerase sigma factor, partial [Bacillus altitudinis]|uniref:RNA polymerase sigma factor n=2 Tax=Bacillati TaxID=1783272 RepID=UPI0035DC0D31
MNNDPFGQGADLFEPDPERPVLDATFEDFLRRNKPLFFKVALNRLQDRQDADEALSDASVAMYQKWERIRVHAKPDALAMRILIDKIT